MSLAVAICVTGLSCAPTWGGRWRIRMSRRIEPESSGWRKASRARAAMAWSLRSASMGTGGPCLPPAVRLQGIIRRRPRAWRTSAQAGHCGFVCRSRDGSFLPAGASRLSSDSRATYSGGCFRCVRDTRKPPAASDRDRLRPDAQWDEV